MVNFKRQKALISSIDWDYFHINDRSSLNFKKTADITPSTNTIAVPKSGYCGAVLGADGHVYFIPSTNDYVLKLHPEDDSIVHKEDDVTSGMKTYSDGVTYDGTMRLTTSDGTNTIGIGTDLYAFAGGVLAPNGYIYCIPHYSNKVVKINTNYGSSNYGKLSVVGGEITIDVCESGSNGKWWGGVLAPNGKIYCAPYNACWVLVIDTNTDTISYLGEGNTSNKFNNDNLDTSYSEKYCRGACITKNGTIVFAPHNAYLVPYMKPPYDEVLFSSKKIDGQYKFDGAAMHNNFIVFAPYKKTTGFYAFEPDTDSLYTLPTSFQDEYYSGIVLGPDQCYYLIPSGATQPFRVFGTNASFGTSNSSSSKWSGGVLAPNGSIYCVDFINLPEGEEASMDPTRCRNVSRAIVMGILDWLAE